MANSFQFRLQSVIRLRERTRDAAADDLKKALQAKQLLSDQVNSLQEERNQLNSARVVTQGYGFDPQKILDTHRYQTYIDSQVAHLNEQISLVEQECQRRRARLVKCEQAVRSLEKLKEKQLADWETELVNKSQDALDQWSGFRYWSDKEE